MKATLSIVVIVCIVTSALPVAAQEKTPLAASIARETVLLSQSTFPAVTPGSQTQQPGPQGSYMSRHPVAFFTLVGAGIGLVTGAATSGRCKPERGVTACSTNGVGIVLFPIMGATAGALVGLVVKIVR